MADAVVKLLGRRTWLMLSNSADKTGMTMYIRKEISKIWAECIQGVPSKTWLLVRGNNQTHLSSNTLKHLNLLDQIYRRFHIL